MAREAEAQQKEMQPSLPRLYSLQGYLYCDLLVARGRVAEAAARANAICRWQQHMNFFSTSVLTV